MDLSGSHLFGIIAIAFRLDNVDARLTIGTEKKSEKFGKNIVEFSALGCRSIHLAIGARQAVVFQATFPHRAPARPFIFPTARTLFIEISFASPAI